MTISLIAEAPRRPSGLFALSAFLLLALLVMSCWLAVDTLRAVERRARDFHLKPTNAVVHQSKVKTVG